MRKANINVLRNWVRVGQKNIWVKKATDPVFSEESLTECMSLTEIFNKFKEGNWQLGKAFYLGDVCFINQVNGGDEWLVVKGTGNSFESISTQRMTKLIDWIRRLIELDQKEGFSCFMAYSAWLNTQK